VKWRTTVVLAVIAVALGVYLHFMKKGTVPSTAEIQGRKQDLFAIADAEAISTISIQHDDVSVSFERPVSDTDSQWVMTDPLRARAQQYLLDGLAGDLKSLRWAARMEGAGGTPEGLASRGLEAPRATLTFAVAHGNETASKDKEEVTLRFGNDTPVGGRVYLAVTGPGSVFRGSADDVYEVEKSLLLTILKPVNEFRDKDLLDFSLADVTKVDIQHRQGELTIEREGKGWRLAAPLPVRARADRDKVEESLRKLASLRIEDFVADFEDAVPEKELQKYGLTQPVLTAKVALDDGREVTVELGSAAPDRPEWRYATTSEGPSIYLTRAEAAELLARPALLFRDRQLTPLTADRVDTITITRPSTGSEKETLVVQREDGNWKITQPREIAADSDAVTGLLKDIDQRTIQEFVRDFAEAPAAADLEPYGLDEPAVTITLETGTGDREVIHLGGEDDTGTRCYLRRNDEPVVLAVAADFRDLARKGYLHYRTKELAKVSRYDVTRIDITRPDGQVTLEKDQSRWRLTKPIEKRAERTAVDDLLARLEDFKADRIVAEEARNPADYGLDQPAYRLEVVTEKSDGATEATVVSVGASLPEGGHALRVDDQLLVAAVGQDFIELLQAEFRYRSVFSFDRDKADRLEVTGVDPPVVAIAEEEEWQLAKPTDRELDVSKLRALLAELNAVRARRWETYEAKDLAPYGLDRPAATVSVHVSGLEPVTKTLMLGAEADGDTVYARVDGDPGVFRVSARLLERVRQSILTEPEEQAPQDAEAGAPEPAAE